MKSFFRVLLLALVLLIVALVSALTAMRFAIHGREVTVPNLVDKSPAEARRIAEAGGFEMVAERQYYSATVAAGRILSQLPPAGTLVRRGWEIRVAQSLGPQRAQIPSVLGQSERAAEMNIRRRGLDVGTIAALPWLKGVPDRVLSQSPPPNASDVSAPKISLLVAQAAPLRSFVMPNFIGQPLGNARLLLQTAGLHVGSVTQAAANSTAPPTPSPALPLPPGLAPASTPLPAGTIVSQNPGPGERVQAGAPVNFEVR
jgi:beta-lactam-binding protein with PASTA domain